MTIFQARYDQAVSDYVAPMNAQSQECVTDLIEQQNQCEQGQFYQRMQNSLHGIADLGSMSGCLSLDNTNYVVVSLNVSTTPVFIRQGLCMPKSCE